MSDPVTGPAVTLRLAVPSDVPRIQQIGVEADTRYASAGHPELADGSTIPTAAAMRAIADAQLVVAAVDGAVVGWVYTGRVAGELCLGQISVLTSHGRRGVGTALLQHVIGRAWAAGERSIVLNAQSDVTWGAPWYERHGFRVIPREQWTPALLALATPAPGEEAALDWSTRVHMRLTRAAVLEPHAAPSARLSAILARNHELHAEFQGGLSNHLSMGARSLAALGGSDAELDRLADSMWGRLAPLEASTRALTADTWREHLGERQDYAAYRRFFVAAIARDGVPATLRSALPALLPGVSAAAFHCLIRLGYGVRFGDPAEIADGLAYWAFAWQPLAELAPSGDLDAPLVALRGVRDDPELGGRNVDSRFIFDAMRTASSLPGFREAASGLAVREDTLARIADATVQLFVSTGSFTALHAVTATHAYRQLAPYLAERDVRWLWQAIVAAYITVGTPAIAPAPAADLPTWSALFARTCAAGDEHALKLVDVAREEERCYGGSWYRQAAALRAPR